MTNNLDDEKQRTTNKVLPKAGLKGFDWTFVLNIPAFGNTQTANIQIPLPSFAHCPASPDCPTPSIISNRHHRLFFFADRFGEPEEIPEKHFHVFFKNRVEQPAGFIKSLHDIAHGEHLGQRESGNAQH